MTTLDPARLNPGLVLSNGNLTVSDTSGTDDLNTMATEGKTSGKWYWEVTIDAVTTNDGWCECGMTSGGLLDPGFWPGRHFSIYGRYGFCIEFSDWGDTLVYLSDDDTSWMDYAATRPVVGNTVYFAVDLDTGNVWIGYTGLGGWLGGGDPATGTTPTLTFTAGQEMTPAASVVQSQLTYNFGASAYEAPIPEGFASWDVQDLTPALEAPSDHKQVVNGTEYMIWVRQPNWAYNVVERLEWRTEVLTKIYGTEERRSLRWSPRKEMEFTVALYENQRRIVENQIFVWGIREWLVPIWWDGQHLSAALATGSTTIPVKDDVEYRDFVAGGLALLHLDATSFEVVEVQTAAAGVVTLSYATTRDWPVGTRLYPLKTGRLVSNVKANKHHSQLSEAMIQVEFTGTNDWSALGEDGLLPEEQLYLTHPVLATPPDDSGRTGYDFSRSYTTQDAGGSPVYIEDLSDVPRTTQSHSWLLEGKYNAHVFRRLMYYMRGKHRKVWLPTFRQDLQLIAPLASGATTLLMEFQGYDALVNMKPNRDHLAIRYPNGDWQFAQVTSATAVSATQEQVLINAPLDQGVTGNVLVSFMAQMRGTSDAVNIVHHHEELMEADVTFTSVIEGGVEQFPIYELAVIPCFAGSFNLYTSGSGIQSQISTTEPTQQYETITSVNGMYVPLTDLDRRLVYIPAQGGVNVYRSNVTTHMELLGVFGTTNPGSYSVPKQCAIHPETGVACFADRNAHAILFVKPNMTDVYITPGSVGPCAVAALADGRFAICGYNSSQVYIYGPENDYATPLITTAATVHNPQMAHWDGGSNLYVSCDYDVATNMQIVNISTGSVTTNGNAGKRGAHSAYSVSQNRLIQQSRATEERNQVFIIAPATGTLLHTVSFPTVAEANYDVLGIEVLDGIDTCTVLVRQLLAGAWTARLFFIRISTGAIVHTFEVPMNGATNSFTTISYAVDPTRNRVYIGASDSPTIWSINASTFAVVNIAVTIGNDHRFITYGPDIEDVYFDPYKSSFSSGEDPTTRYEDEGRVYVASTTFAGATDRQIALAEYRYEYPSANGIRYFEVVAQAFDSPTSMDSVQNYTFFGLCLDFAPSVDQFTDNNQVWFRIGKSNNGAAQTTALSVDQYFVGSAPAMSEGEVVGFAFDTTTGKVWISRNGVWVNGQSPAYAGGLYDRTLEAGSYVPFGQFFRQRYPVGQTGRIRLRLFADEMQYLPVGCLPWRS